MTSGQHETFDADAVCDLSSPLVLAQALLRLRTITPARGTIFTMLRSTLEQAGFSCRLYRLGEGEQTTDNLYARVGTTKPVFVFCGHLDTVEEGDATLWSQPPYDAVVKGGMLFGRGSVDMKSSVAAFLCAAQAFLKENERKEGGKKEQKGSIVVLLTGDEEGTARFGTQAMLDALPKEDKEFDACLTGEPTSQQQLGDTIKIGRRGSLSLRLGVRGRAGHSAYPQLAENAVHKFLPFLYALSTLRLDEGTADGLFEPSSLQVSGLSTDTQVSNLLPAKAEALVSVRYNPDHDEKSLLDLVRGLAQEHRIEVSIERLSGSKAFLTHDRAFSDLVASAIEEVCSVTPSLSTGGGTSDSRFLYKLCPTLDFGPIGTSMHSPDECVATADLEQLSLVYRAVLERFFSP